MQTAIKFLTVFLFCFIVISEQGCKDPGKTDTIETAKSDTIATDKFADNVRVTDFQTPEEERASFKLPPGFEITLFASEPDISKPINMEFDERGRLWVTNTVEYPFPANGRPGRDRITILEDTNGDGKADKFTHFEDTLNIPIGITPVHNGVIAYSIPNVYRFTDSDGDGKADEAKKLIGPFGFTDTHGMVNNLIRGWDGWIYACHGFSNTSVVAGADGDSIKMVSGNTFRFREDGSRVEATSFGRVNPFGYAYDEWGYLYSLDCHTKPIYQMIQGAHYPGFGLKPPTIGWAPEMMSYEFGSTANSGLVYYTGEQFPEAYRNNFFSGNVVTSRINRNTMSLFGSSPESKREEDFLTTSDPWFRPVDLKTAPDGSMYIADFYNRIIGHYEVPKDHPGRDRTSGRIWKISYTGNKAAVKTSSKDWSKATLDELVSALNFPQLNIRMMIANYIVDNYGGKAIAPIKNMISAAGIDRRSFIQGMWILYRLKALPADLLDNALGSADPMIRVHALRVLIATNRISIKQHELVLAALTHSNPQVQRLAVEVLGHFTGLANLPPLLSVYERTLERDTHLRYTALLSIRDNLANKMIMQEVAKQKWNDRQLSLLIKVIPEVPSVEAASFALDYLRDHQLPLAQLMSGLSYIGRYIAVSRLSEAIYTIRKNITGDPDLEYAIYKTIRQGLAQRATKPNQELQQWGTSIANQFLAKNTDDQVAWFSRPIKDSGNPADPWKVFERPAVQGFTSARNIGSERSGAEPTGILSSPVFKLPPTLSMTIFDNDINRTDEKKGRSRNAVRIRLSGTNAVVAEFRFDLQQPSKTHEEIKRYSFDLSKFRDQMGYFEVTDSSETGVIGISAIEPAVLEIPDKGPAEIGERQVHAAEIVADYKLTALEPALKQLLFDARAEPEARTAAADALMSLSAERNADLLRTVFSRRGEYSWLKAKLVSNLGQQPTATTFALLETGLTDASRDLQVAIVRVFAGSRQGIDYLLKAISAQKLNASILAELPVKEGIAVNATAQQQQQLQQLTAGIPGSEDRQQLIRERIAGYAPSIVTEGEGQQVFIRNCGMCHQIDGKGGTIGPTLSGIGSWGQKALTEKILNPNGSISSPYRTYNLTLKNGKKLSGLFRREEGAVMIFADFGGQEFSVPKAEIKEKIASKYTLMPDAFSKTIAKKDFDALLKYLLSVRDKK